MAGVNATIDVEIRAKQTGAAGLGTPNFLIDLAKSMEFSPGTASIGQANVLYTAERTLAASANENLDLAGALTDAFGATIAAAEVVAIYIEAAAGNTNNVQVTRPASNGVPLFLAAGDGIALGPGDCFLLTNRAGVAVTAGTGDLINVANSAGGTGVTYKVVVIGRTVAA